MRLEELQKIVKGANQLHKMNIFVKQSSGGKVKLWGYFNYKRFSLGLPAIMITDKNTSIEETALLRKAVELRNKMEAEADNSGMAMADRKQKVSAILEAWINSYANEPSRKVARAARDKFLAACGDMAVSSVSRRNMILMIDKMKQAEFNPNYIRTIASRIRSFCNWAEQRGYMDRVDTRKLLPPEQFGEVKTLGEEDLKLLAATRCEIPDVKDLFMLGVYTAQRIGEIKQYTFAPLYDKQIRVRQGKTGKFIIIPLSENALSVMRKLKWRREKDGKPTGPKDKMFDLPNQTTVYKCFHEWLEAAGIDRNRITLHNSRSTAISLLINKGVPESVTQELANHSDPRMTARYYRQIDIGRKQEALDKIPKF